MANVLLPMTSPQFLTEQMFINYGFFTGSATSFMIQAAFAIAENQVARDIGTFLVPTTYTGTYGFLGFDIPYETAVGKLISVDSVTLHQRFSNGIDRFVSGTAYIRDFDNGYYYLQTSPNDNSVCVGCAGYSIGFYQYNVAITAGYPSGTVQATPTAQLAACMAADIALKQMYDEGIGIQYENLTKTLQAGRLIQSFDTSKFISTIYGPSSRAVYISKLLEPFKIYRTGFLGSMGLGLGIG